MIWLILIAASGLMACNQAWGQRARFSDPFLVQPGTAPPASLGTNITPLQNGPVIQNGPLVQGQILPGLTAPPNVAPPANRLGPGFDPFANSSQAFPIPYGNRPNSYQIYPPASSQPLIGPTNGGNIVVPQQNPVQILPPNPPIGQQSNPGFFQDPFRNQSGLIRNNPQAGTRWPSSGSSWPSLSWARLRDDVFPRLLERPRFRHTWIAGSNGNEMDINTTELTTTLSFPIGPARQPLRVTPGFTFNFWNGPELPPLAAGFDLPSRAYDAFLSFDHMTNPQNQFGLETNFTIGVYSDFDNFSSDSLRMTGVGLGWLRINQINTFKFGIEYYDRIKTKLLPAFGLFVTPSPDMRFDIYFPRPRLAQRIPSYNDFELWLYVGGEYGGGSWTIERPGNVDDQVDLNDVRAFLGVEWLGRRRVTGFFEIGYVFERELIFRSTHPFNELDLQDSFMLRTGLAF